MRWTREQLRDYENRRAASRAKPQPPVLNESLAAPQGAAQDTTRIVVRITSYRRLLLDPDNLTGGTKYFVDALRYAGAIPDDRPQDIELIVRQEKSQDERTEIELTTHCNDWTTPPQTNV